MKAAGRLISIVCCLMLLFGNVPQVFALGSSGFENASYSARSLGQSNGVIARPEEPSTVVFNPAGIPELKGVQASGDLEGLSTMTHFKSSVTHGVDRSNAKLVLIPTGFMTANLGEKFDHRVGVGAGLSFPFGVSNRYPATSNIAKYIGYSNQIKLAALNLATGVKVTDKMNVGGGITYYRLIQYDQSFNYPNSFILTGLIPPESSDGIAKTYMSGDGWGWNFGTLLKPAEHHRLAMSYRSRATVKAKGRVVLDNLILGQAQGYTTTPYFETGAKTDVALPSNITVGYAYIPSDKWAWEMDLGWTGWSVFADQNFEFNDPNPLLNSLGTVPRNFHNTFSVNTGGHYQLNEKLDLLGGLLFYTNAAPSDTFDAVIPDSNRFAGTLGFTYKVTKHLDFSTTYFAILFEGRSINNDLALAKSGTSIDGNYDTFIHGFMTGLTYRFGQGAEEGSVAESKTLASPGVHFGTQPV